MVDYVQIVREHAARLEVINERGQFLRMDSLSFVELVEGLEHDAKVKIPVESLRLDFFDDVASVARYLEELARGATRAGQHANLVAALRWRAIYQRDRLAYQFLGDDGEPGASCTYGELDHQARVVAAALGAIGAPGDRVLLVYPQGIAYLVAFFGCLYAARVPVPVYPPDPRRLERTLPRLLAIANDARTAVVATIESVQVVANEWARKVPDLASVRWLATDTLANAPAADVAPGIDGKTSRCSSTRPARRGSPRA